MSIPVPVDSVRSARLQHGGWYRNRYRSHHGNGYHRGSAGCPNHCRGLAATEYTIIRSEEASQSDINQAIRLRQAIVDGTGANISLGTDWVKRGVEVPATGLEIVVGDTNRPQTVDARENQLRERDWGIFFSGDRVTITGGSDEATVEAVEYFIANWHRHLGQEDRAARKLPLSSRIPISCRQRYP